MAGLFDFKSAEQILQERMATTEKNRLQMLRDVSQGAPRPDVARLGANLGYLLGKSLFGGKSEKEQLTEAREMGETTQVMEQADVGGEGSAQWDGEGSSYGAGVQQQAQAEEQRRLGLLPQEMQQAIGEERQAKQLEQAFQNVDMNDSKQTAELVKLAMASGNTEAASLAVSFHKNAVANRQAEQEVEKKRIFSDVQQKVAGEFDATKDPVGFNQAMFNRLSENPLTASLAQPYQNSLVDIGIKDMQKRADDANKPFTEPNTNIIKMVESNTVNDPSAEDLSDNDKRDYNIYISSRVTELLKQYPLDQAMSMAREEAQAGVKKEESWWTDDTFTSPRKKGSGDWSIEVAK